MGARLYLLTSKEKKALLPIRRMIGNAIRPFMRKPPAPSPHRPPVCIFQQTSCNAMQSKGIQIAPITLHVGIGTFLPIETETVENHVMETEYFEIGSVAAEKINNAKRVIAVGTTSTRTLESVADKNGYIAPQSGDTCLYIYPGYKFKRVNGLLTNFHLPQSSLFLLVWAFAGTDFIKEAYAQAVENRYLFYSYGDCMLIL